jgi:vacuolar-type H+-ATPase subunit I/STV1
MDMAMPNTNPNVNSIYQAITTLSAKVDTVLQGFEARLLRTEQRLDKIEEQGRASLQWSNDAHTKIIEQMHVNMQTVEQRILEKLDEQKNDLKQTEIRLNNRLDEHKTSTGNRWLTIGLTVGGWLLAIVQFILSNVHPR